MRRRDLTYILSILLFSNSFFSQTDKVFSFNEFVDHVTETNPLSVKADNVYSISVNEYKAAKGAFDPWVNGSLENKQFDGKNYYNVLNAEMKQPLFASQFFKAGYDLGTGDLLNPQSLTSQSGLPYAGIEFAVLQGMMIDKRRAELLKSKEKINFSAAERRIQLNDLYLAASSSYAEWVFEQKQIKLYEYFIDLAKTRYIGLTELANIGERAGIDSIEAAINYRGRILDFQSALIEYQRQTANLNVYYKAFSESITSTQFSMPDSLDVLYTKLKTRAENELAQLKSNNPVIQQYESKNKILSIEKRLRKEMIKPKLDLKYNFLLDQNNSDAAVLSTNNYKWGAGLSFPLFLTTARNNYKAANLELMNNNMDLEFKNRELSNKIVFITEALLTLNQQIANAERNAFLSAKLLEAEKLKFYNGESTLFLVNTRENKLMETELKKYEYKFKYILYTLKLIHLQGNLNYKI